jgi:hypothetical protein
MRDLVVLRSSSGPIDPAEHDLGRVVERVCEGGSDVPVLDLPHPSADARRRFDFDFPIQIDALAWLPVGEALPDAWAARFDESFRYTVAKTVGWPAPTEDKASPDDVVKQVSFLHGADGYTLDAFRAHYRDHVGIARKYMPALWQYVQNDVEAIRGDAPEARGVLAVSELWFRTTDDFVNRYFPSEEDQRAFSSHEGFLDLRFATSFVCASARPSLPETETDAA